MYKIKLEQCNEIKKVCKQVLQKNQADYLQKYV